MGHLDLECIATGLGITETDDGSEPRCVFFFLAGKGREARPISLGLRGAWNGAYFELDEGWHQDAWRRALEPLDTRWHDPIRKRTASDDPLLEVVSTTLLGTDYIVTADGQLVTFCAALESFYDVFAAEDEVAAASGASAAELAREALGRDDFARVYEGAPVQEVAEATRAFRVFRRTVEASPGWHPADGHQLHHEDVVERLDRNAERLIAKAPLKRGELEAALAAYGRARAGFEGEGEAQDEEAELRNSPGRRGLIEHIQQALQKRPDVDATALASSIEFFRMLKAIPPAIMPAGTGVDYNKRRWTEVIERVGTSDVEALVDAFRGR